MQKPTTLTGNRLLALEFQMQIIMWLIPIGLLSVKAYILNPYVYLLFAFLAPEIEVASSYDILVFPENARLELKFSWSIFVAPDT